MLPPKKANTRYQGIPHVRVQLYHTVTDIITAASSGRKIVRKKSRTPTYNTFRGIANSKNLKPRRTHRLEERQLPVPSRRLRCRWLVRERLQPISIANSLGVEGVKGGRTRAARRRRPGCSGWCCFRLAWTVRSEPGRP